MSVSSSVSSTSVNEKVLYSRVAWRLLPFLFWCYVLAFLDRVNVGFAKLTMQQDLGFSDTVYGLGAGIFFIGYFIFEVPSNLIMARVGAKVWIARIMMTWGVISALTMFVSSPGWFYVLRFSLGVAEAGFFPGIIYYLTCWFPSERRGRIIAVFMSAIAVAGVIGGPLSGWIMEYFDGKNGWAGWQWLFLLEGLPSVLTGLLVLWVLDSRISDARWLSAEEKRVLEGNLERENASKDHASLATMFRDVRIFLLSGVYFCISLGLYGLTFWLPQLIRNSGVEEPGKVGLLSAVPFSCAVLAMWLIGRNSDRTGERRWHFALCGLAGAVGLVLSISAGTQVMTALAALSLAAVGIYSALPIYWTLPTSFLSGKAAAAGIAMANSIGGLAGFCGPFLIGAVKDASGGRMDVSLYVIAAFLVLGGVLVFTVSLTKERV